jgi:hypothetical protein|tara:strand:+ start:1087 stop:1260 length:174 start_codon:yes stop_codon:yes gene_type:complete
MKTLFEDMTPIEWVGVSFIGFLTLTAVVTFTLLVYSVITGDADISNATFGIADVKAW